MLWASHIEAIARRLHGGLRSSHKAAQHIGSWRCLHLATTTAHANGAVLTSEEPQGSSVTSPDARFQVLGSSFPLLSVSLSASQTLHTARGTLVGVGGNAENVVSKFSMLNPFYRASLGIPFLYQKISSTSPVTALISTKSSISSFAVVHLDGSTDWKIAGHGILAWTGQTVRITPTLNRKIGLGNRGSSVITGRGLLAITGRGSISQIKLEVNENYVVHPSNVLGYSLSSAPPLPYRLPTSSFRLQVPDLGLSTSLAQIQLFRTVRESAIWRLVGRFLFSLRIWSRRIIWGDRLFLQFQGPVTILLQTRGGKSTDILTTRDISDTADTPTGALETRLASTMGSSITTDSNPEPSTQGDKKNILLSFANVDRSGNVNFEKSEKSEKSGAALDQRAQK